MAKKQMETLREKHLKYISRIVFELTDDPHEFIEISREEVPYLGPWALCDRQLQQQAGNAATTASNTAAGYGAAAGGTAGTLTPILTRMAQNPSGYSPTDVNNMRTNAAEGASSAANSAENKATLAANRSHNVGSLSAVQDEAARNKMQTMSKANLGVDVANANLKQNQQQAALAGLQKLYGTQVGAQVGSQGQIAQDVNAGVNAGNSGWLQNTMGVVKDLSSGAGAVMGGLYGNQGALNS